MSTPTTLALGLLVGAVVWLLCGPDGAVRGARLAVSGRIVSPAGTVGSGRGRPGRGRPGPATSERWDMAADLVRRVLSPVGKRWGMAAVCLPVGAMAALLTRSPVPLVAGVVALPLVRRRLRRLAADRAAGQTRAGVIELCSALAAELRAGRAANVALADAVSECSWAAGAERRGAVSELLAAARFGGDVPAAFRRMAALPGAEGLAGVGACWQVAVDSGAGLAEGLDRIAGTLRAEEHRIGELRAQLAGPRSTALLLAVLPLFAVALGTAVGAAPLAVLLHTPAGLACVGAGAVLEWAGLAWTARIVRGAP